MKNKYVQIMIDLVKTTENDVLTSSDVLINGEDLFSEENDNK